MVKVLMSIRLAVFVFSFASAAHAFQTRVTFMAPLDGQSSQQLNDRNSLTNNHQSGWLVKADDSNSFVVYLHIAERITDLTEIKTKLISFTSDPQQCRDLTKQHTFELEFQSSRFQNSLSANSVSSSNSGNSSLLVAHANVKLLYNSKSYFTCLCLSKSEDTPDGEIINSEEFIHQGANHPYTQIITTRELMPI